MASYCINIMGAKGGVGNTVFALNLAAALYRETKEKTLLLDLDILNPGDSALMLGTKELRCAAELLPVAHKLNEQTVDNYITRHKSGVWVLPALNQARQASQMNPERFAMLIKVLRNAFPFIIIDSGSHLTPLSLQALQVSSSTLLVVTPEILVIHQALNMLRELTTLQYPQELVQVVVNRYLADGPLNKNVIQSKLKKDILSTLEDDPDAVADSVHNGTPAVIHNPRSAFAKGVENLVHLVFSNGLLRPVNSVDLRPQNAPLIHIGQPTALTSTGSTAPESAGNRPSDMEYDRLSDLKMRVHTKLIEALDLKGVNTAELAGRPEKLAELKEQAREAVAKIVQNQPGIKSPDERHKISKEVLDEALGLGPLEDILADSQVSEIMVNRKDQIYVERQGRLTLSPYRFTSDKHLLAVIERIVAPIGRRIDEKTPMVDARLKDGSRVHAIIPPLTLDGPMLTIRKFGKGVINYQDLVGLGAMTNEMADFLRACIMGRLNIIISGGTGTGKTTLLNILAAFIPSHERIITIEDAAELRLPQEHVGRLESRPPNLQGDGAIPIRELVRNALRMRPDRIIVGECRSAETLDMLQAMNTGHDGSLTTIHSNSPRDCINRLETLVMFAGMDLPSKAIREQISSAVNLVVQLSRFSDGSRRITYITEITGMEGQTVTTQDLFVFKQKGLDSKGKVVGKFSTTGLIPTFAQTLEERGIKLPEGIFSGKVVDKKP